MTINFLSRTYFIQNTYSQPASMQKDPHERLIQMNKQAVEAQLKEENVQQEQIQQSEEIKAEQTSSSTIYKKLDVETERQIYFDISLKPKKAEDSAITQNPFTSSDNEKQNSFQEKLEIIRAGLYKQLMANVTQQPAYALAVNA